MSQLQIVPNESDSSLGLERVSRTKRLRKLEDGSSSIPNQDDAADLSITDLINKLDLLFQRSDPLVAPIVYPKLLLAGLEELRSMVEMTDIKQAMVNQIKFLIANRARCPSGQSQFEGHMLHSVISGNPGTGKTTVARILAKIWMALGWVKKQTPARPKSTGSKTDASSSSGGANAIINGINQSLRNRISELEMKQRQSEAQIDHLRSLLIRYQTTCSEIRRHLNRVYNRCHPQSSSSESSSSSDEDSEEEEWNQLFKYVRTLRFGVDQLIRGANRPESGPTIQIIELLPATASTTVPPIPEPVVEPTFVVAAREDLIAEYLGQTAIKTKEVLERARGGVLFIDEAYLLCNMDGGSKDKYGEECLGTINEFMSLYPDEIIIIFSGYKEKLMQSIFKAQPGLLRRCVHFFEIKDYTARGMAKIFQKQLGKHSWTLAPEIEMEKILDENKELVPDGGGGTEKLAFFAKIAYGNRKFEETIFATPENPPSHDSVITPEILNEAFSLLKTSSISTPGQAMTQSVMEMYL